MGTFTILREAVEKAADGDAQRPTNFVDHGCAHPVPRIFIFLELLKTYAYRSGKLSLRYIRLHSNRRNLPADIDIGGMGIAPSRRFCPSTERTKGLRLQQFFRRSYPSCPEIEFDTIGSGFCVDDQPNFRVVGTPMRPEYPAIAISVPKIRERLAKPSRISRARFPTAATGTDLPLADLQA